MSIIKCPNCNVDILEIYLDGQSVTAKALQDQSVPADLSKSPTDTEMLDWLQRVIFDESETYCDVFKFILDKNTVRVSGHSRADTIREAIQAAMREAGDL